MRPLILDLDGSLAGLERGTRLPLGEWQEAVRFACTPAAWRRFGETLRPHLAQRERGPVLLGSGDFHHLTQLLLASLAPPRPIDVVVLDNHPDNMRFPFGIHCGSWVAHAARLPQVRRIHVAGICSTDVAWWRAWENRLMPLAAGKLIYWPLGVDARWADRLARRPAAPPVGGIDELLDRLIHALRADPAPVYLSIDKDVLAPEVVRTNWDQGRLDLPALARVIDAVSGRLVGSDITGEVSRYAYRSIWKRWLAARDRQPDIPPNDLPAWQAAHLRVNHTLLDWLDR